ncbi:hypothetical protein HZS55_18100 [Halosimplex rubrum]|uniref:Uncharacterized protein n=1 Tax=Halosimplex rubrum TaxID=869889 RepID=A0A7D5T642_9EURY|nr:hypothetical protein [Halosimplex rubrum]QLH79090.1 hypothetical protein HZS55_18100 [Halosimplex rubrum]
MGTESIDADVRDRYDHGDHWISAAVERGLPFGLDNRLLTAVVKFNLIPDVLAALYVVTQWGEWSVRFLAAAALFTAWANVAPYLIWYYDKRVLPSFFDTVSEIVVDTDRLDELAVRYNKFYEGFDLLSALLWGGGFLAAGYFGAGVFEAQGMTGDGRLFLWTTLAYGAYVGGVLGEGGFSGTVTTLFLVREVAGLEFEIQPLHPDGLGGLSTVGEFAIRTTLLWSSASLLIPLAFQLISGAGSLNVVMAAVTAGYIGTILATFLYPTLVINRRSERLRTETLEAIRREYLALQERVDGSSADGVSDVNDRLEMQRLRNQYDDYATVRLYPLQIEIFVRLAGSVLFPLFFLLLEYYLPALG